MKMAVFVSKLQFRGNARFDISMALTHELTSPQFCPGPRPPPLFYNVGDNMADMHFGVA